MSESRKTIVGTAVGEIVEKKSRFIAELAHVENEAEAEAFLAAQKKKYYDARHHCSAFVVGSDFEIVRSNDDGEPGGSAGRPMLTVLQGEELHDVIAVVTRYFGGTLLGVGGLIRAYSGAVKAALENAVYREVRQGFPVKVTANYNDDGKLKYMFRQQEILIMNTVYGADVETTIVLDPEAVDRVMAAVTDLTAGRAVMEKGEAMAYSLIEGEVVPE
ncbi:MAG: YigZ family protein [Lachnospiraceae bacterium]|nr:YigZ family protein [Lachnospiraceae bacterium]